MLDDLDGCVGVGADRLDQAGDLLGGQLGLLGKLANLLGDDREASPLLAGAGGLDRGVQRQQVGLPGDTGDRLDDRADLLGLLGQPGDRLGHGVRGIAHRVHRLRGLLGRAHAFLGRLACLAGDLGGDAGVLGARLDRARHLFRGLPSQIDRLHLALGAGRDLAHRAGHVAGRSPRLLGRGGHLVR